MVFILNATLCSILNRLFAPVRSDFLGTPTSLATTWNATTILSALLTRNASTNSARTLAPSKTPARVPQSVWSGTTNLTAPVRQASRSGH